MQFKKINWQEDGTTLTLAITNPPTNSLSVHVVRELEEALILARVNKDIEEVVLTGGELIGLNAFSTGADIKGDLWRIVTSDNPYEEGYRFSHMGHELVKLIRNYPKPVTALVDGYALGGGMELASVCREIHATRRSVFGLPELTLGITPGWGGLVFFIRRFGIWRRAALEFILEGRLLTAEQALAYGLIDMLVGERSDVKVPVEKPVSPTMQEYVKNFAESWPWVSEWLLYDALDFEAVLFGKACAHPDAKTGIEAFIQGNKNPQFIQKK